MTDQPRKARSICIEVYGIPGPGGSKQCFLTKSGRKVYKDMGGKKTKAWRRAVTLETAMALVWFRRNGNQPFEKGVAIDIHCTFWIPRPQHHFSKSKYGTALKPQYRHALHVIAPDATKLWRSTEDALTDAGIWHDDSQVVSQSVSKHYATPDRPPGATIRIAEILPLD